MLLFLVAGGEFLLFASFSNGLLNCPFHQ